jgi:CPA2 family monovalent cation:H+ antiporter-2
MFHETPLIATIVAGIGLAFVFGTIANRLRLPPLVGYLLAGILVGPHTPGFVADQALAPELAEIGVILLMFGVGLHFSLKELLSVRAIAVPGALVQIAVATAMGAGLAWWMGWPLGSEIVFGIALSVASTVVLLRALQERDLVQTDRGRIAVGWLIVEDLAMVLVLVLLPVLAGALGTTPGAGESAATLWLTLGFTLVKLVAFVALMLVVGRRVIPWILNYVAGTGSHELFRLAVLAIALGVAFGAAKLFGVSLALGAFFAGMILGESELSQRAADESLPLRDAFAVLFFVSVGMLFDPLSVVHYPLLILATLLIIVVGKSIVAFLIVLAFGRGRKTALTIAASLAQVGEFSFILAELGVNLRLLPEHGRDLILAGAILSILLNPLAFAAVDWLNRRSRDAAPDTGAAEPLRSSQHTILVGHGRVGILVARSLKERGMPFIVIESADKAVENLRADGVATIAGNAADPKTLSAANLATASRIILAIPNAFQAGQIIKQAKTANQAATIIARAHSDAEVEYLTGLGADSVIMGEREIARGILDVILREDADAQGVQPSGQAHPLRSGPPLVDDQREGQQIEQRKSEQPT